MYAIIAGGGGIGYHLTKALHQHGYEVLLIEKNRKRAMDLADDLGERVMYGDACEVRVLNEAGARRADVVVAATGDDEDNLIICQLAKNYFKVKRVLAIVRDPRHEALFARLGIHETICSTRFIFNILQQEVEYGEVLPIGAIMRGQIEVVEAEITPESPVAGKSIGEIELPPKTLLAAVVRHGQLMLGLANLILQPGDTVIALTPPEHEQQLARIIRGTAR
ncbi:MAG: TrkA family potassium uptake protein [Fimbriimonadales bacterium]|nr:TrkA family potassium uptake protein [Fimbriimonadales bacterium]MDW8051308.1 TrkA family potassium uptake protein [Armatimonadota bacterium]